MPYTTKEGKKPVYIRNISSRALGVQRVCTYRAAQHCYYASETCRDPTANQNVFKCMTCVKLMKIHEFSLSGLLESNHQRKDTWRNMGASSSLTLGLVKHDTKFFMIFKCIAWEILPGEQDTK